MNPRRKIKRYPNRKLYDTQARRYITLKGVASLIRAGQEVQVIDNVTGDDLTALTLSQIIFEEEKARQGSLPHSLLASLIQASSDRLHSLQRSLPAADLFDQSLQRQIEETLQQKDLPSRSDMERLRQQLDTLSAMIDQWIAGG